MCMDPVLRDFEIFHKFPGVWAQYDKNSNEESQYYHCKMNYKILSDLYSQRRYRREFKFYSTNKKSDTYMMDRVVTTK